MEEEKLNASAAIRAAEAKNLSGPIGAFWIDGYLTGHQAAEAELAAEFRRGFELGEKNQRLLIARKLEEMAENYPADVFTPGGISKDAVAGSAMRHAYLNAARIAREEADD